MAKIIFPPSPTDGDIFEAAPGLFYQYSVEDKCWVRIDGINSIGLATPIQDGLMSPEDLQKINGLIVPPPQTSLKSEDCDLVFDSGRIGFQSTDDSLEIDHELSVQDISGETENLPWSIHENTAGYDFRLNLEQLIQQIRENGNLTEVKIQGADGPRGERGPDGRDRLDTGPVGEPGEDGAHSTFGGALQPERVSLATPESAQNRAIVDITTETGSDGNYLIVKRANIGDPLVCPDRLLPINFTSPWVLVFNEQENTLVRTLKPTPDCTVPCKVCNSSLHYLNIEPVFQQVYQRFLERLLEIKTEKERIFIVWMKALIALFNEQKAALCCALENCITRKRNTEDRRYIERQRIQASQADQRLVIDGADDRTVIDTNVGRDCDQGFEFLQCISSVCTRAIISGIASTGLGSPGEGDPNWLLTSSPGNFSQTPVIISPSTLPFDWPNNIPNSLWIGTNINGGANNPFGVFEFTLPFTIQNVNLDGIEISGTWVGDDTSEIFVNDQPTGNRSNVYTSPKGFKLTSSNSNFLEGENKLQVKVSNSGGGPMGFRMNVSSPTAISSCNMSVDIGEARYTRLLKPLGDPESFENTEPGDGVPVTSRLDRLEVSTLSPVAGNKFKVALLDSNFNTYVWPLKDMPVSEEATVVEFPFNEMQALNPTGGSILAEPMPGSPIIALLIELDIQETSSENDAQFSQVTLVETNGTSTSLAGFEWGGNTQALRAAWFSDCRSSEDLTLSGVCNSCVFNAVVNPRVHFNQERALIANLPRGSYEAEIVQCCAQLAGGVFTGKVSIGFNEEVTLSDDTASFQDTVTTFPNLGTFGNNTLAEAAYLGQKIPISHGGGPLSLWIADQNAVQNDNSSTVTVCIRPTVCGLTTEVTASDQEDTIFVYANSVSSSNLIGFIDPFDGQFTAADNYNYGGGTDPEGPGIVEGPQVEPGVAKIFFYNGTDGLSAFFTLGADQIETEVNAEIETTGNSVGQDVIVSDDPSELITNTSTPSFSSFTANWVFGDGVKVAGDNLTDWDYQIYPSGAPAGWFNIGFDDSGFLTGQSPFAGRFQNSQNFLPATQAGVVPNTFWPSGSSLGPQIVLRTEIDLGTITPDTQITINFKVIDKLDIYFNGQAAFIQPPGVNGGVYEGTLEFTNSGGTVNWSGGNPPSDGSFTTSIPSGLLVNGSNLIAIRGVDSPGINNLLSLNILAKTDALVGEQTGDGGVIGYFDDSTDPTWVMAVDFQDLGAITELVAVSSTGDEVSITVNPDGIGTDLASQRIFFTRIVSGCQMFWKQIEWLERGHRTGASCSAVVDHDGVRYIVVKRSIGIDKTCGGGESATNPCVSTFIASGQGHPAIAWPTFNGQEFLGLPTSGFHTFVEDDELSSILLSKIQAGDVIGDVNGSPATEIPFIIFPTSA